ncbi:hypothetical protein EST38_g7947 [Candolleomyces aberdarensis]|uniref:Uncharacterized protein n=1 Tax=Candolleomyces aberdarensis TaxID=2316362 RepID=A0A4Q2DEF6_9AGAR|nr:hypothetical protein EST38_g7947 [Candolleomyces aberdarensis]
MPYVGRTKTIPIELWTEIFDFALGKRDPDATDGSLSPLELASVCDGWKDIVEHTPALWRDVYMRLSYDKLDTQVADLKRWIKNARSLPLKIYLQTTQDGPQSASDDMAMDSILDLLLEHSARIQVLLVVMYRRWYSRFADPRIRFPILDVLCIDIEPHPTHDNSVQAPDTQYLDLNEAQFPELSQVQMTNARQTPSRVSLSSQRIVNFSTLCCNADDCISRCVDPVFNVQNYWFVNVPLQSDYIDHDFEHDLWYNSATGTPRVLEVDIAETNPFTMAYMLVKLGNCSIRSLSLHAAWEDYLDVAEIDADTVLMFHDFLLRVVPRFSDALTKLWLEDVFFHEEILLDLLNALPGIHNFDLIGPLELTSRFIQALAERDDSVRPPRPKLLPVLQSLNIDATLSFDDDTRSAFIESRTTLSPVSLDSVFLNYRGSRDAQKEWEWGKED